MPDALVLMVSAGSIHCFQENGRVQLRNGYLLRDIKFSITGIKLLVPFANWPQYLAGNASGDNVRRKVFVDNRPCSDNRIVAYRDTGKNRYARTDPYVAADVDGNRVRITVLSQNRQNRMARRRDNDIGAEHAVIADEYIGIIDSSEIAIAIDALAHMHVMESPSRMCRNLDMAIRADFSEHFLRSSFLPAVSVGCSWLKS